MKRTRPLGKFFIAIALLVAAVISCCLVFLQSNWIPVHLRQVLIEGVYDATGARTEIPSIQWNWRTLSIEIRGFTMHGFEPPAGPPLFTAPRIRARLQILSLLDRRIQLSSLVVNRPQFFLNVRPDGSTNIPGPKHAIVPQQIIDNLLDLKLPHVEGIEGLAQINGRRIPINLVGDHVAVLIQYQNPSRRYALALQSPALQLGGVSTTYFNGSVQAKGELWRDHFALTASHFHSHAADLLISGSLYEFNNPVIDWRLASTFAAAETLSGFGIKNVTQGGLTVNGIGHHDGQTPFFFDGTLKADHLTAVVAGMPVDEGSVRSKFVVDTGNLRLSDLAISSREGQFAGSGTLAAYRDLQLSGTLSRIDLQTAASRWLRKPFPWSGSVAGPVQISATIRPVMTGLNVRGLLEITPGSKGIPVAGDLHYLYQQGKGGLTLGESHMRLPHTELSASGNPEAAVAFKVDSTNLGDLDPALTLGGLKAQKLSLPSLAQGGAAHLQGTAHLGSSSEATHIDASLDISRLQWTTPQWGTVFADRVRSTFSASSTQFRFSALSVESPLLRASATGQAALSGWHWTPLGPIHASGSFNHADVQAVLRLVSPQSAGQLKGGSASGSFDIAGSLSEPAGTTQLTIADLSLEGEHLDTAGATLRFSGNQLHATEGHIRSGTVRLGFSATYDHEPDRWSRGTLQVALDTNPFSLSRLRSLSPALRDVDAEAELHARTTLALSPGHFAPLDLKGTASLRHILWNGISVGDMTTSTSTAGQIIKGELSGTFRGSRIGANAELRTAQGTPAQGRITFEPVTLNSLRALLQPGHPSLFSGSARGDLLFDGPLEHPEKLHAVLHLQDMQVNGPPLRKLGEDLAGGPAVPLPASELILENAEPVTVELTDGVASIRSAQLGGRDTQLSVSGTAGLAGNHNLHLTLKGGIDLRLLELLYPEVQIGGQSKIEAAVGGTLSDPQLAGSVQFMNATIFSALLPNGLSNLAGIIRFDQHRATLEKVTAHTGGGSINVGGFVTYSPNHPLVYRLDSTGQNIRVRYANGISLTGDSQFSLTGTSDQSLLSGSITVSRVVLNPSADLGNVLAVTAAPAVAVDNGKDYLSHLQLDIHVESAPNLQLDTALSSGVQAAIDLQLRGTPKQPVFLGSIEANEGDIKVFGSRYSINRGQISFANSARLEPVLDLDLQTQARGITVDITVSGTLNKLNINYRSDPPLQPRDIIALLTVGRTPQSTASESNVQTTNDSSSLQAGANSVLGQAIAPVSNRLSKLFGITNIKIDPLVQGITNTPQARLTLEQQISRQITVTYITNLSQTSEQIFRLEYALNPQFSLIALRDDNGEFGIDILYKKRFK